MILFQLMFQVALSDHADITRVVSDFSQVWSMFKHMWDGDTTRPQGVQLKVYANLLYGDLNEFAITHGESRGMKLLDRLYGNREVFQQQRRISLYQNLADNHKQLFPELHRRDPRHPDFIPEAAEVKSRLENVNKVLEKVTDIPGLITAVQELVTDLVDLLQKLKSQYVTLKPESSIVSSFVQHDGSEAQAQPQNGSTEIQRNGILSAYLIAADCIRGAIQRFRTDSNGIDKASETQLSTDLGRLDQAMTDFLGKTRKDMKRALGPSTVTRRVGQKTMAPDGVSDTKSTSGGSGLPWWSYLIIAGAVVLGAVAVIFLVANVKRRSARKADDILPVSSKTGIVSSTTTFGAGAASSQDILGLNSCEYPEPPNPYSQPTHSNSKPYITGVVPEFFSEYGRKQKISRKRGFQQGLNDDGFFSYGDEFATAQPSASSSNQPASSAAVGPPKIDFRKMKPDRIKATLMPIVPHGMPSAPTTPTAQPLASSSTAPPVLNKTATQPHLAQAVHLNSQGSLPLMASDPDVEGAENIADGDGSAAALLAAGSKQPAPQHTNCLDGSPKDLFTETYLDMFGAVVAEDAPSPVHVRPGVHHPNIVVQGVLVSQAFFKNPPEQSEDQEPQPDSQ